MSSSFDDQDLPDSFSLAGFMQKRAAKPCGISAAEVLLSLRNSRQAARLPPPLIGRVRPEGETRLGTYAHL
jgi:hypothetical protein